VRGFRDHKQEVIRQSITSLSECPPYPLYLQSNKTAINASLVTLHVVTGGFFSCFQMCEAVVEMWAMTDVSQCGEQETDPSPSSTWLGS